MTYEFRKWNFTQELMGKKVSDNLDQSETVCDVKANVKLPKESQRAAVVRVPA